MKLQDILAVASNGCITNRETIERVVTDMVNLEMTELILETHASYKWIDCLVSMQPELDGICLKDMKYVDLLCAADIAWEREEGTTMYDAPVEERLESKYGLIWNIGQLMWRIAQNHECVNLFLSLNLERYLCYMSQVRKENAVCDYYRDIDELLNVCDEKVVMVRDALKLILLKETKSWRPWMDFDMYRSEIYDAYEAAYLLFIKPFRDVFPKLFCYEEIL